MRTYGSHNKTGSCGGRIGTHKDGCICKKKMVNKTATRFITKLKLKYYHSKE